MNWLQQYRGYIASCISHASDKPGALNQQVLWEIIVVSKAEGPGIKETQGSITRRD